MLGNRRRAKGIGHHDHQEQAIGDLTAQDRRDLHQPHRRQPFQQAGAENNDADHNHDQHHQPHNEINLPLERSIGDLKIARGRSQLIGEAGRAHLLGLHVSRSGDAEAAGKERITGLLPNQIRLARQQGLVHLQQPVTEHDAIDDDLVAGRDTQDVTLHQLWWRNHLLSSVAHRRNRRPIDQRNLIQLPFGANFLHRADQGIDEAQPTLVNASFTRPRAINATPMVNKMLLNRVNKFARAISQ